MLKLNLSSMLVTILFFILLVMNLSCSSQKGGTIVHSTGDLKVKRKLQLTKYGKNSDPLPSPDGIRIAFRSSEPIKTQKEKWGLWVMNADGNEKRQLTSTTFVSFVWSPDSQEIYAIDRNDLVKRIDIRTGEQTVLCEMPKPYEHTRLIWSPDRKKIAYLSSSVPHPERAIKILILGDKAKSIMININFGLTNVTLGCLDWSHDGKNILFTVHKLVEYRDRLIYRGKSAIGVINLDGTKQKLLSQMGEQTHLSVPRYSPDGSKIHYLVGGELWVMNADGSQKKHLATGRPYRGLGTCYWSPDSKKIAYVEGGPGGPPGADFPPAIISVVDVDTAKVTELMRDEEGQIDHILQWSPDGKKIYYGWKSDIWAAIVGKK